jgi:hypothetical protein
MVKLSQVNPMVVLFLIILLWLTNWFFSGILVFGPLGLLHGVQSLLGYGILAGAVIILSWLIGKSK